MLRVFLLVNCICGCGTSIVINGVRGQDTSSTALSNNPRSCRKDAAKVGHPKNPDYRLLRTDYGLTRTEENVHGPAIGVNVQKGLR